MKKGWCVLLGCLSLSAHAEVVKPPSVHLFADLLVWKLREGSADDWAQLIAPAGTEQSAQLVDVPFTWNPGLRVGGSYQSPDSSWRANIYATLYHTTGSQTASGRVYSALLGNFYAGNTNGLKFGPYYDSASMRWEYAFDNIDAELSRLFKIGDDFSLSPYVGFKTAFIDQSMLSHWVNPHSPNTPPNTYTFTSANENLKNNYWGMGPALGVNAQFTILNTTAYQLGLYGDISAAVMYGHWTFSDVFVTNDHQTVNVNTSPITGGSTMWRGQVGLSWQQVTASATYSARLAYEAQTWFNQLQYYSYSMGHLNDLMSLQGGDFELGVAFL